MEEVAWGTEGSYVERSNEEGWSTSSVVARMRDHGAYAGWPNGLEVTQGRGVWGRTVVGRCGYSGAVLVVVDGNEQ